MIDTFSVPVDLRGQGIGPRRLDGGDVSQAARGTADVVEATLETRA